MEKSIERFLTRRNWLLRAEVDVLRALDAGVQAYSIGRKGFPRNLVLRDGRLVEVSVVATDVAPKFECFSLSLSFADLERLPTIQCEGLAMSVLLREEYVKPFDGNPQDYGYVGSGPGYTQAAAKPGKAPSSALATCLVAYGLLFVGGAGRLVVAVDWFPFNIDMTTDEERIAEYLGESDIYALAEYLDRFGV